MSQIPTPLFIFEMANNHMGDVSHGQRVVREFAAVAREFPAFHFAFKLQYRDLDTFIHPAAQGRDDIKYVKRFSETRLDDAQLLAIVETMREEGLITVCTPFDEPSVSKIEAHGIEIVKIASCSLTDWPLLERVVDTDKPIVASTAGAELADIDRVVAFLQHRQKRFALMHCVAEYPTPDAGLQLNQIDLLRARYPEVTIGYSTHEHPDNATAIQLAVAKGARVFEKHVGVPTPEWPLNPYSASPEQVRRWLEAARLAFEMGGAQGARPPATAAEAASLNSLRRGVFARRDIAAGEVVRTADVYFAFPPAEGQWLANDWSKYHRFVASGPIAADAAVSRANAGLVDGHERVLAVAHQVRDLLKRAHIPVPGGAELEISHHYGLDEFHRFGLTMITVVNREYCKKLLVLLPGQVHPEQHHKVKEETFHVLHGDLHIKLDGELSRLGPGDVVTIGRGVRHEMTTEAGAVVEELSSTHHQADSFYSDPAIGANQHRKTYIKYWLN